MMRNNANYQITFVFVLVLDLFCQVVSEYCGNDILCNSPYKCCNNLQACCYDSDNSYTRGFKLHVWNMWYFWLIIIFILMSCFGGCGYYRRRRLAATLNQAMPPTARTVCTTRTRRHPPQPGLYAYTGPGVPTSPEAQLPPPYTEVMQQPSLYPVNKMELPPYPGPPGSKDVSIRVGQGDEEVAPPPYYQVASLPSQQVPAGSSPLPQEQVGVPTEPASSQQHSGTNATEHPTQPASSS